jgi:dihydroflavonol-4-reductase
VARVFVTGGSGFIGGALTARLVDRGDDVVALARSDEAAAKVARRGAAVARGDVLDEDSLADGMAGCGLVYHVAGVNTHCPDDPDLLLRVNVQGAESAVRAAARAGVRRLVLTSSAASVGEPPGTVGREDTPHRGSYLSVYDRSKHHGEQAAFRAARNLGVEVVAVNPSSVQGPGRYSGNGKLIIAYLNGRLRVFVDTYISVVDIDDTVQGHLLAPREVAAESGTCSTARRSRRGRRWRSSPSCPGYGTGSSCCRRRWRAPAPSSPRASRARGGGFPRSAPHGSAPSCTDTATTARGRPGSSA